DLDDDAAGDRDVGRSRRCARAVDDATAPDDDVNRHSRTPLSWHSLVSSLALVSVKRCYGVDVVADDVSLYAAKRQAAAEHLLAATRKLVGERGLDVTMEQI